MQHYDVIIVGGGPTGVALGIELGLNNIKTLILEKHAEPLLSPRAQSLNARSMEFFMRWHIDAALISKILLTDDYQGVWCSNLQGKTYGVSSSNEQLNDDISPQRGIRIPLWLTEEVLRNKLSEYPSVTFLKQYEVVDVNLNKDNVSVTAKDRKNPTSLIEYSATYVVACDGANSIARQKTSIQYESCSPIRRSISVVFEAPDLAKLVTVEKGFLYYLLESPVFGVVGPIDIVRGLWHAQLGYAGDAEKIEEVDVDQMLESLCGITFSKKILKAHFWNMHIQIADRFSEDGRLFLVGDSAHGFVPTGGFGLNTGLGDVLNLGWKLAAVLQLHAKPSLLSTYEQERRPVCLRNLQAALKNADDMVALRIKHDPKENPEAFARASADLAKQFGHSLGASMGYAYFDSSLTQLQQNQSTELMPQTEYVPIPLPGYFIPPCRLKDGKSIYEIISPTHWTLIVCGESDSAKIKSWQSQFPFTTDILKVQKDVYPSQYILIRPDWHISFAGNKLDDCRNV